MMRKHPHLLRETLSKTNQTGRTLSEDLLHQVENTPWRRTAWESIFMSQELIQAEPVPAMDQDLLLADLENQFHQEEDPEVSLQQKGHQEASLLLLTASVPAPIQAEQNKMRLIPMDQLLYIGKVLGHPSLQQDPEQIQLLSVKLIDVQSLLQKDQLALTK